MLKFSQNWTLSQNRCTKICFENLKKSTPILVKNLNIFQKLVCIWKAGLWTPSGGIFSKSEFMVHTNFDTRTMDFGSGVEAGLHLKGREFFQPPFFSNFAQPELLGRFKKFLYQRLQVGVLLCTSMLEYKNVALEGPCTQNTGVKGICKSQISKLGLKSKPIHPGEHFNKRIVKSTSVWGEDGLNPTSFKYHSALPAWPILTNFGPRGASKKVCARFWNR